MKLNIGAGNTVIEGFTPVDRKLGTEAAELEYDDNSIEEIRASHILEHFSRAGARNALNEWVRVLKPGGLIRIAVPDVNKIDQSDPQWYAHLMGGQTDENDFHKSCYNERLLEAQMIQAGLIDIAPWSSDNTDCASLPVSLNLQGRKPVDGTEASGLEIKIKTMTSVPRYGPLTARGIQENTLSQFKLSLHSFFGVFWGQHMQRGFETALEEGCDWILTIDYDTVVSPKQLDRLMGEFGGNSEIDALAAMQVKREDQYPLLTCGAEKKVEITRQPLKVTTAHFGLTLLRVECLEKMPKPWFHSEPNSEGGWDMETDKLDPDIWFWQKWREAGNNIYVDPLCNIGHLEECVSFFDDQLEVQRTSVAKWRELFLEPREE